MKPGSWDEYRVLSITGGYNPSDGTIGVSTRELTGNNVRITNLPYPQSNMFPAVARVYGPVGVTQDTIPPNGSNFLVQSMWRAADNPAFIGEAGGANALVAPPEPILSIDPVAGEHFELLAKSYVVDPNTGVTHLMDFPLAYWTTFVDQTWGQWQDCTRTALIENPNGPGPTSVYNYVFDGLLRDLWYLLGVDRKTRIGNGFEMFWIGSGNN